MAKRTKLFNISVGDYEDKDPTSSSVPGLENTLKMGMGDRDEVNFIMDETHQPREVADEMERTGGVMKIFRNTLFGRKRRGDGPDIIIISPASRDDN